MLDCVSLRTAIQTVCSAMVDVCDVEDICALVEMCKFSSETKVWPDTIHICVLGQTELAHEKVHPSFDRRVPKNAVAQRLYEPHSVDRFFVLGLTGLIRESGVHGSFDHAMDGSDCTLDKYGSIPKIHHHCLVAFVSVLAWLQGMSLRTASGPKVANAYIFCMCVQGKHRSMYFGRVLFAVLQLVFKALKVEIDLQFHWPACERILSSVANNDSHYNRQAGPVTREILTCWIAYYKKMKMSECLFVLDFDEKDYDRAMKDNGEWFDIMDYMKQVGVSPVGNVFNMLEKNEKSYFRICQHLGAQHFVKSWQFFVRVPLRKNFPGMCSICSNGHWHWRNQLEFFFEPLICFMQKSLGVSSLKARPVASERVRIWADAEDSEEGDGGAQASGEAKPSGASERGVSLRAAPALEPDFAARRS